ncbi:MAG: hypothetical protein LBE99_01190 [Puniceicoccales bacterium]|jgi:hypothetical protein|nr:hypothetical protein [Puniceicoccales bacterium]
MLILLEQLDNPQDILKHSLTFIENSQLFSQISQGVEAMKNDNPAAQRAAIRRLNPVLSKFSSELINNFNLMTRSLNDRPHHILMNKASVYFRSIFPDSNIKFSPKLSGDQLGDIIEITLEAGEAMKYHIKTHRNGLRSQCSNSAKPVDIKELFVYKFLECSELGTEAHFFLDNLNDFYIATKDAGSDASTKFFTYAQVRENQKLCSVANYKTWIPQQGPVNPFVIQVLVMADIVGRIFGLSDLVTNDGNIGLICDENKIVGYKIIDFDFGNLSNPDSVFEGFKNGNDIRHYLGMQDQIIHYFLAGRPLEERGKAARNLFKLDSFLRSIEEAYGQVLNMGIPFSAQNLEALAEYVQQVRANVEAFASGLSAF